MKKVFLAITALILLISTAGCTVEVTPISSSESSSESSSSSSSKSSSSSSESASSSSSEASSSSSESSSKEPSEPSRSESSSASSPQQEEMEGKVAYSLIKMFENKRFYLRCLGDMGIEGQGANSVLEIAMQDEVMAVRMDMEEAGGKIRMVIQGDKLVYILDDMRTIMYLPITEDTDLTWDSMNTEGLQYIGMGSEDFKGRILPYEEYLADTATTRYFFSGKNVVGIRSFTPGEAPMDMEILEMSENIPIGIFDIPRDYTEMSSDQAF